MTEQQNLAQKTGLSQSHISTYLKDIKQGKLFRKPILKILETQGKGDIIRKFIDDMRKSTETYRMSKSTETY